MSLNDRSYMHRPPQGQPEISSRKMLLILIAVNLLLYLFQKPHLALTIFNGEIAPSMFYQLITAGFLHYEFTHLLFNMWGLWLFGGMVIPYINGKKMLLLYLLGVICGNLLFILCNLNTPGPITLLGASGAVCAVMAAAAMLEPERRLVMLFMPFTPIKTSTMVICYTAMEIIFELLGRNQGIAHLAHLGGFIGGYIAMRIFFNGNTPWDPFRAIFRKRPRSSTPPPQQTPPPESQKKVRDNGGKVTQKELDDLLDKLSNYGINSLSEYELERLRRARRQMRGEE